MGELVQGGSTCNRWGFLFVGVGEGTCSRWGYLFVGMGGELIQGRGTACL